MADNYLYISNELKKLRHAYNEKNQKNDEIVAELQQNNNDLLEKVRELTFILGILKEERYEIDKKITNSLNSLGALSSSLLECKSLLNRNNEILHTGFSTSNLRLSNTKIIRKVVRFSREQGTKLSPILEMPEDNVSRQRGKLGKRRGSSLFQRKCETLKNEAEVEQLVEKDTSILENSKVSLRSLSQILNNFQHEEVFKIKDEIDHPQICKENGNVSTLNSDSLEEETQIFEKSLHSGIMDAFNKSSNAKNYCLRPRKTLSTLESDIPEFKKTKSPQTSKIKLLTNEKTNKSGTTAQDTRKSKTKPKELSRSSKENSSRCRNRRNLKSIDYKEIK